MWSNLRHSSRKSDIIRSCSTYVFVGNVRQGPCGFVPACHCDSTGHPISEEAPAVSKDYTNLKRTQQILSERMAELKQAADLHAKQVGCLDFV